MDEDKKTDEIMKQYLDLPEDVQKALFAPETSNSILATGKKYNLAIDKMGELADETGLVMLGITPPSEYIKNLVKRLGVDAEKAKGVAEDINQKVFSPIRESLKKIHGIGAPVPQAQQEKTIAVKPLPKKEETIGLGEKTPEEKAKEVIEENKKRELARRQEAEKPRPVPEVPPIFVKKIPVMEPKTAPAAKQPMSSNPLNIKQELEKMLNPAAAPVLPKTPPFSPEISVNTPQTKDPYREPID